MKKLSFIFAGLLLTVSVFSQWSLTGNSGTNPATNFVGTIDAQPLRFRVYNTHAGVITLSSNTAFGFNSLGSPSVSLTGTGNTAFGAIAAWGNTSGFDNSAFGTGALTNNSAGSSSTAIGYNALYGAIGSNNTAVGCYALYSQYQGTYNTAIGYSTSISGGLNLTNSTLVGNGATVTASHNVRIGNTSIISIGGYAGWSNISDGRVKKNIRPVVPGLDFILKLQPVTYIMDLDAADKIMGIEKDAGNDPAIALMVKEGREAKEKIVYTGFIAQDVEKAAHSIGYDFSGVDAAQNENDLYGLRYAEFVVPLVKAVQELSEQNVTLQNQIDKLSELVQILLNKEESEPLPDAKSSSVPGASLKQNAPNPFNSSTTIEYTLPQYFKSAKIVITAMSGRELRQFPVSGAGAGSITISSGSLSSGMYYYSLYVDDILVDTKRMIVT